MFRQLFSYSIFIIVLLFSTHSLADWHRVTLSEGKEYRYFQGEVEAVNRATVASQTSARIKAFYFDVDDYVKKGDTIVEFTNDIQQANYEKARAYLELVKVELEQSEIDYKRTNEIYTKKLISKSKLDQSKSNRDAKKAKYNASKETVKEARKQLDFTIIKAPYNGLVTKRFVELGETVNPGTAIIEGLNLVNLRVVTQIPENIIHKVRNRPDYKVFFNSEQLKTSELTIFPYADKATRTFKARIAIDSTDIQLFPGMTVKVGFVTGSKKRLIIPTSAVTNRSELSLVTVKKDDRLLLRHIKLGQRFGDHVEVLSGLSEGEVILLTRKQSADQKTDQPSIRHER